MSLKDFEIGSKLGRKYFIIGEGAYSTVFKVERLANKQIYALKKVKLANLSEKEIENALNEVRILASLKNKNIIGYKEVFLEGKNLW